MRYAFVVALAIFVAVAHATWAQQPAGSTAPDKNQSSPGAAKPPEKTATKKVVADLSGFEFDANKKPQGLQLGAGSRGASVPPALYAPSLGKAYSLRPVFCWGDSPRAQKFTFRIYDSDDDEIYEQEVAGNLRSFAYPADAPALKAGATYSWTVQAMAAQLIEPPEPVRFMIVAGADRQTIEQALPKGDTLLDRRKRAQIFVDHRLWYDAVEAYSQLISENRNNADLYTERAHIYAQLPETQALANQDMEQASKLQSSAH